MNNNKPTHYQQSNGHDKINIFGKLEIKPFQKKSLRADNKMYKKEGSYNIFVTKTANFKYYSKLGETIKKKLEL